MLSCVCAHAYACARVCVYVCVGACAALDDVSFTHMFGMNCNRTNIIGVLALTLLGFLSNYFLGRVFINLTEKILDKVPFLSTVYRSAKQIVETFGKVLKLMRGASRQSQS